MSRRDAQDVRGAVVGIALFTVIAFAATWLIWSTLNNFVSGDTDTYSAQFTDASGLHEGDDVRVAGVKVGRVEEMELEGTTARVTFAVQREHGLFTNTWAQLRYQNLTGQRYLALRPGAGPVRPLEPGSTIPVERTDPSLDLSVLLGGMEPLFSVLEPAEINQLADNIIAVTGGEGPALAGLLTQANRLLREFSARDEIIGEVITNLSDVLAHLDDRTPQFERLIGQSRRLVNGLNAESGQIFDAVERIGKVSSTVTGLVRDIRPSVKTDIAKFNQVGALFLGEERVVEETIRAFPRFVTDIARVTQHGSWLDLYACRINLEAPGIPEGTVAGLMGSRHSETCR